jgi:hypothetical protein
MDKISILIYFSIIIGFIVILVGGKYAIFGFVLVIIPTTAYTFYIASKTPPIVGKEL